MWFFDLPTLLLNAFFTRQLDQSVLHENVKVAGLEIFHNSNRVEVVS